MKRRRIKRHTETMLFEYTETSASVWNDLLWKEMQDPTAGSSAAALVPVLHADAVRLKEELWETCWDDGYQCE